MRTNRLSVHLLALGMLTACSPISQGSDQTQLRAGELRGTVSYPGIVQGTLQISVFASFPPRGAPIATQRIENPVFPQAFTVPGVPPGRHFVLAIVDRNPDDGDRYHPIIDPGGAYGGYDAPMSVQLSVGEGAEDVHIDLLDPSADSPWVRRGYR